MDKNQKHITLTNDNFKTEVLQSEKPVLVDFWAEWCGPCRSTAPLIEELAHDYEGTAKIGKLNVDQNTSTVDQYGIKSIPTILFFKNGKVMDRVTGVVPKEVLTQKLGVLLDRELFPTVHPLSI